MSFNVRLGQAMVVATIIVSLSGCGGEETHRGIEVSAPYVNSLIPGVESTAAYFTINNYGDKPISLVNITTDAANAAEFHITRETNGGVLMESASAISIPAHDTVVLEPGSQHIMLTGVKQPLVVGEVIPMTLSFDDGTIYPIELVVKNIFSDTVPASANYG